MPRIDQQVVQMLFDNKQFEQGVEQSRKSLDNLKKSLELDKATSSLSNIEKSVKGFNMSGLSDSIDKISDKFSMLGILGVTAMQRIANAAIDAGTKMVRSLTIDQISAGQAKYETRTKAVQTITNATGKSVEEVEKVLSTLMKYTDETSYDFSEMVSSIGKFTSVGVDLNVAEKAMEGIANEAAKSGAGIQEANRAMYNFAQALSAGYVKLIDWKSIENANMATKEFKEQLIATAIETGTLGKKAENVGTVMKQTTKATKKSNATFKQTEVNYKTFNETLSEGWLTSDVLIKTLAKYSDTSTQFGLDAFHAAQEALTFTDAINAVKDAVSSGWMQSFQYLFGNLDEARKLWTDVANNIYDFVSIFFEGRNNILKSWHELGGYNAAVEAAANIWETFMNVVEAVKGVLSEVFPPVTGERLAAMTEKVREATENWRKMLTIDDEVEIEEQFRSIVNYANEFQKGLKRGAKGDGVRRLQQELIKLKLLDENGADGIFGPKTEKAFKELQKSLGVKETGIWDASTEKAAKASKLFERVEENTRTVVKYAGEVYETEEEVERIVNHANRIKSGLKRGMNGDDVKKLQEELIKIGLLDENSADGIFGPNTEAAVKKLQNSLGVEATGEWDKYTKRAAASANTFTRTEKIMQKVQKTVESISPEMQRIQDILRGIFSVIDVGRRGLTFVFDVVKHFISLFKPLGDSFLSILALLGRLTGVWHDNIVESDYFGNKLQNVKKRLKPVGDFIQRIADRINGFLNSKSMKRVKNFEDLWFVLKVNALKNPKILKAYETLKPIAQKIKDFILTVTGAIKGFFSADTKGSKDIGEALKKRLEPFAKIGEWFKKNFSNPFKKQTDGTDTNSSSSPINILQTILEKIKAVVEMAKGISLGDILGLALTLLGVFKLFQAIKGPMEFVSNLTQIPKSLNKAIKKHGTSEMISSIGEMAKNIAIAIGVLTVAIVALSSLDTGKAWNAVGIIGVLMAMIGGFAFAMSKINTDVFDSGLFKKNKMTGILQMAVSMLLFARVVATIGKLPLEQAIKGIAAIGIVFFIIYEFAKKTQGMKFDNNFDSIGVALNFIAEAIKKIGSLPLDQLLKGIVGLGLVFLELSLFLKYTGGNGKKFETGFMNMIGIGVAVWMLAQSLGTLAKLSWEEIGKGLVGLGGVLLEFSLFLKITNGMKSKNGLLSMIGIGVAVKMLSASLVSISKLSWSGILKGVIGLGAVMLELVVFMKLIGGNKGGKMLANAIAMVAIGAALSLFVKTVGKLGKMSTKRLIKGVIALGVIFLEIAAFMKLIGGRNPLKMLGTATAMIGIGVALNLMALSLRAIGSMNMKDILKGVVGLGSIMLELSLFMKSMGGAKTSISAIPMMLTLAGSLLIFGMTLKLVADVPWATIAAFGVGFGVALRAVSDAIFWLEKIPITGALTAIANLDLFIANLVLVLGAFAGLQELTGGEFGEWMRTGAEVIGQAIGGFINGIIKGIKGDKRGPTKSLADYINDFIGELESLIPNLRALADSAGGINISNLQNLADAMGKFVLLSLATMGITWSDFVSNIATMIGGNDVLSFADKMKELTPKIQEVSDVSGGINVSNLKNLVDGMGQFVLLSLATLGITWTDFLTNIASMLTGNDVLSFADKMKELAPKIKDVSESSSSINVSNLKNLAEGMGQFVLLSLATLGITWTDFLTNIGSMLTGSDVLSFADRMKELAPKIKEVSEVAGGINSSNLQNLAEGMGQFVLLSLATLGITWTDFLTNIGSMLTGSDVLLFADRMKELAPKIKDVSDNCGGINSSNLEDFAGGMEAFSKVAKATLGVTWADWLGNIGAFISGKSNEEDALTGFVDKMIAVVPKMKALGEISNDIDTYAISNSAGALTALTNVANAVPGANGLIQKIFGEHDIEKFGTGLETLGSGLKTFYDETKEIPPEYNPTGITSALTNLAGIADSLPAAGGLIQDIVGTKSLEDFGSQLNILGSGLNDFAVATEDIPTDYDVAGPVAALDALSALEAGLSEKGGVKQWFTGEKNVGEFGNQLKNLGDGLKSFFDSTKDIDTKHVELVGGALQELSTAVTQTPAADIVDTGIGGLQRIIDVIGDESAFDFTGIETVGKKITSSMGIGISNKTSDATNAINSVTKVTYYSARNYRGSFEDVGKYLVKGLAVGIQRDGWQASEAFASVVRTAYYAGRRAAQVNSPSRLTMWMGEMIDMGLVVGLQNYSDKVAGASSDVATTAIDSAKLGLNALSETILNDADNVPTIRPVLDLSEIQNGAMGLGSMFGNQTIGVRSATIAGRIAAKDSEIELARSDSSNVELAASIATLNDRLDQLDNSINSMQVVMDSGALVGQLGPGINRYLGKEYVRSRR